MLKVLLVDDDPSLLAGLRRALLGQPPQWQIRLAKDGREGLDLLDAETADLVISDMRMPGMDGSTFLEEVKEEHPHSMRVILSGYSELDSSIRSISVAHQFLSKPCSPLTLLRVIEQARGFYEQIDIDLRTAIADVVSLPSPPEVVAEFERAVKANESPAVVAEIAGKDIALTAKILQLVNSAFFGYAQPTVDVKQAVMLLGVDTLRNVGTRTELWRPFNSSKTDLSIVDLEAHANAVSKLAASLVPNDAQVAGVAGLLHDIGLLLLASEVPDEITTSSVSPTVVGAWLLAIWGIPPAVIAAVFQHHEDPSPLDKEMNAEHALRIAEAIESRRTPGWAPPINLPSGYVESFGLNAASL